MVSQLVTVGCRSPSPTPVAVSARSEIAATAESSSRAPNSPPSEQMFENCRGVKSGQFVCNGKARVECHAEARGHLIESCPEACADGVCTCAHGTEPTCTAQPTAPCTEQGPNVPIIDIAVGGTHTCALMQGGCVRCWTGPLWSTGKESTPDAERLVVATNTDSGQLGIPGRTRVNQRALWDWDANVALGGKVVGISAGDHHTCAILEGGCVRCWGANQFGQLGLGNTGNVGDNEAPTAAHPVLLGGEAKSVALGYDFSCALMTNGMVRCWGKNDKGQLGLGSTASLGDAQAALTACPISLGGKINRLTVGLRHSCALLENGTVRCWGANDGGALGVPQGLIANSSARAMGTDILSIGDNEIPSILPPVALPEPAVDVSTGESHTCAQLEDNSVYCWGSNRSYQLGIDDQDQIDQPLSAPMKFPSAIARGVYAGIYSTCVVGRRGVPYCAGSGVGPFLPGQDCCGQRRSINNGGVFPGIRRLQQIFRPKRVFAGPFQNLPCALTSQTRIQCWDFPGM